jgi:hypothetical protein
MRVLSVLGGLTCCAAALGLFALGCTTPITTGVGGSPACDTEGSQRCNPDTSALELCQSRVWVKNSSCDACTLLGGAPRCVVRSKFVESFYGQYYTDPVVMNYQVIQGQHVRDANVGLRIEIYPYTDKITTPDFQGSVVIDAPEANYATCSLCVLATIGDRLFMANGGYGNLSLEGTPSHDWGTVNLTGLWLREVTIDENTWETQDVAGGQLWYVESLTLGGYASYFPCTESPVAIDAGTDMCVAEELAVTCIAGGSGQEETYNYLRGHNCAQSGGFCVETGYGTQCQRCEKSNVGCLSSNDRPLCEANTDCEFTVSFNDGGCGINCSPFDQSECNATPSCYWLDTYSICQQASSCSIMSKPLCQTISARGGPCEWVPQFTCTPHYSDCNTDIATCAVLPGCVVSGRYSCVDACGDLDNAGDCTDTGCHWNAASSSCLLPNPTYCSAFAGDQAGCHAAGCAYASGYCVTNDFSCDDYFNEFQCTPDARCKWQDMRHCSSGGACSDISSNFYTGVRFQCDAIPGCQYTESGEASCVSCGGLDIYSCNAALGCAWSATNDQCMALCDAFTDLDACTEVPGCDWSSTCYSISNCNNVVLRDCETTPGCYVSIKGTCSDNCAAKGTQARCEGTTGCQWTDEFVGCADACSGRDEAACRAAGCVWDVAGAACHQPDEAWDYMLDDQTCRDYPGGAWTWNSQAVWECRAATCSVNSIAECNSTPNCGLSPY